VIVARAGEIDVDRVVARRECVVVIGEGELRGDALAAALHSDFFLLRDDASIAIDSPRAWAAVAYRAGPRALPLLLSPRMNAESAMRHALCDALVPAGSDPVEWIAGRSEIALDSAAALIAHRGGDALERAEFARLFGAGEPQRGLTAFLEKRKRP
jgi:acetyl-CoA carboxylase alpha subunit